MAECLEEGWDTSAIEKEVPFLKAKLAALRTDLVELQAKVRVAEVRAEARRRAAEEARLAAEAAVRRDEAEAKLLKDIAGSKERSERTAMLANARRTGVVREAVLKQAEQIDSELQAEIDKQAAAEKAFDAQVTRWLDNLGGKARHWGGAASYEPFGKDAVQLGEDANGDATGREREDTTVREGRNYAAQVSAPRCCRRNTAVRLACGPVSRWACADGDACGGRAAAGADPSAAGRSSGLQQTLLPAAAGSSNQNPGPRAGEGAEHERSHMG
jgi:hypothetical protein